MRWNKPRIVYIDIRWLFLKVVITALLITAVFAYRNWTRVTLVEFRSDDLNAVWQINDTGTIRDICRGLKQSAQGRGNAAGSGIILIRLISSRETREFTFTEPGVIYDVQTKRYLKITDPVNRILQQAIMELRRRSPYGEMTGWREVKDRFPIKGEALITDLDTGTRFSVRRTGGYSHADIEPLAQHDAEMIKKIYGGQWSWKRRAVVAETNNMKIAASLTGMPQGRGEITDNGCHGKFDLYFAGDSVEKSINLSHLVTIWKAAGKTQDKLKGLAPEKSLLVLFTALDQRDLKTLQQIVSISEKDKEEINNLIGVTVTDMRRKSGLDYQLTVSVSKHGGPYNCPRRVVLHLYLDQDKGIYKANPAFLEKLLS